MFQAIILEDDILSSWDYEMILDELGISCIGTFKSWKQAISTIKNNLPDFMIIDLFLDQNESGIDFLNQMKDYHIPSIVVSGFLKKDLIDIALQKNVIAFVPKPIDKTLFTFHVKKLIIELKSKNYYENHFVVKDNKTLIRIPHNEIKLIEIDGNYSVIILDSGKKFVIKMSLVKVMEKIEKTKFLRCFRSVVVNLDKVKSFDMDNDMLTLKNGEKIKVGAKYRSDLKKAIQNR